jgi:hypothetical protein
MLIGRRIFHTTFMGTENSSADTRGRAKELSEAIGSYHIDLNMDTVVTSIQTLFTLVTNKTPSFKVHGGSDAENLALQNIQVSCPAHFTELIFRPAYVCFSRTCLHNCYPGCVDERGPCLSWGPQTSMKPSEDTLPNMTAAAPILLPLVSPGSPRKQN